MNLDIVVLSSQANVEYFSGWSSLMWPSHSRPIYMLIAPQGQRVVVSRIEERNLLSAERSFEWTVYDGFLEEALKAVVAQCEAIDPAGSARLGLDYGFDMAGRGSLGLISDLTARLGAGRLTEAAGAIWEVRAIKSRYEADMLRTCHQIVDRSFDEAVSEAQIGISEAEFYRCLFSKLGLYGAERTDRFPVQFGSPPTNYGKPLSERRLASGDYVWVDFRGATYGGYPADRGRIARAGMPEDWELDAYRKVRSLTHELARSLRPGVKCDAAYGRFQELWAAANVGPLYARASRIAHGGGLDITEPPSVMPGSSEVIEQGMVLHVEPKLERNGAVIQFEEIVFVGEHENEFLHELSPAELPLIQAVKPAA